MRILKTVIVLLLFSMICHKGAGQLGTIPVNPSITKSIKGVHVEISIGFWVNPELLTNQIPPNTKLTTVKSYGIPDSVISSAYQNWVDASLVILAADSIKLNDESISSEDQSGYSEIFWWLQIEEGDLEDEPNARGNNQAIEYKYWVPDTVHAKKKNDANWNTGVGSSTVNKTNNGWEFSIHIDDDVIEGSYHLINDVRIENYELPAYSTIWQLGKETDAFTVYTFQGHKSQRCKIDNFEVQGDGILANSLKESTKIQDPYCVVMFGWEALAGHYNRDTKK